MDLSNEIASLIAQSREVLELSQSDDEDAQYRLEYLLNQRLIALNAFFLKPKTPESSVQVDEMIKSILAIDAQSIHQIEKNKNGVAKMLRQMRQGRQALKAYGN